MITFTFKSVYKVKQGRKMVEKSSTWDADFKSEFDGRLIASAMNWTILAIR